MANPTIRLLRWVIVGVRFAHPNLQTLHVVILGRSAGSNPDAESGMTEANIGDADGPKGERHDAVSKSIVSFMHFEASEWIPDIAARFRDDGNGGMRFASPALRGDGCCPSRYPFVVMLRHGQYRVRLRRIEPWTSKVGEASATPVPSLCSMNRPTLLSSFPRRRESSDLFWRDVSKSLDPGYRFAIPG